MEKLIFEYQSESTEYIPATNVRAASFIENTYLESNGPNLPTASEQDVARHFTNLSKLNYGVDNGFYPLGSCTMKYNPKINEEIAGLPGLADVHPHLPTENAQGVLQIIFGLEKFLTELSGFNAVTFQPAAGAHGEITGVLLIKAYHQFHHSQQKRRIILIPDTAHGTNPATAALAGYEVKQVKSDEQGNIDIDDLRDKLNEEVAVLMLTNPNTLGLFEKNILLVSKLVHDRGALLYGDGANFNALMGLVKPAALGFDLMHFNLHKTFATPHGGGGPGSGAVAVTEKLASFLPIPIVREKRNKYYFDYALPNSIGRMISFYGNFLVAVKAYGYLRALGKSGVSKIGKQAILNANYLRKKLEKNFIVPYARTCMHEFIITPRPEWSVNTLDIAKRIIDYGFHPPTIYFPLIVHEAMMIEPTETETKTTLDEFAAAMQSIAQEAENNAELLKKAPVSAPVGRADEARAGRQLILKYEMMR